MSKVIIHGIFDDEDQLKDGATKVVSQGHHVKDVFSLKINLFTLLPIIKLLR